ncbi:hypothetical protein [Oceanobacillus sp. CF4.6]|uniref:hypothetical protein n=1 Tax=Oceanobacillus sp. CF4.6 TaxID=3373080 RepID=UPI003EE5F3F4
MNKTQVEDMEHALRNGNRFYSGTDDKNWNELVEGGFATKHPGWEDDKAYFRVTNEGKEALKLTDYQLGKLKHAFGLDYSKKPYRNYYHCNKDNDEWEDMCAKGYATKRISKEDGILYFGTLKSLREVYRRNVSRKYFDAIDA